MAPLSAARHPSRLLLLLAAVLSCSMFAVQADGGFHPWAVIAALLPLQLSALIWVWARRARWS